MLPQLISNMIGLAPVIDRRCGRCGTAIELGDEFGRVEGVCRTCRL